jgi:hypothetical protein
MPTKDEIVRGLIDWHFTMDPETTEVYRFVSSNEDDPKEPIKLLDVTTGTLSAGRVMTFTFGPTNEVPYATVTASVTPEEMEDIEREQIALPTGWRLDQAQRFAAPALATAQSGKP